MNPFAPPGGTGFQSTLLKAAASSSSKGNDGAGSRSAERSAPSRDEASPSSHRPFMGSSGQSEHYIEMRSFTSSGGGGGSGGSGTRTTRDLIGYGLTSFCDYAWANPFQRSVTLIVVMAFVGLLLFLFVEHSPPSDSSRRSSVIPTNGQTYTTSGNYRCVLGLSAVGSSVMIFQGRARWPVGVRQTNLTLPTTLPPPSSNGTTAAAPSVDPGTLGTAKTIVMELLQYTNWFIPINHKQDTRLRLRITIDYLCQPDYLQPLAAVIVEWGFQLEEDTGCRIQ